METILKVTAEPLPKGGFRYLAHFVNGEEKVIRQKATRFYRFAARYSRDVQTGPSDREARRWMFSSRRTFRVVDPEQIFEVELWKAEGDFERILVHRKGV